MPTENRRFGSTGAIYILSSRNIFQKFSMGSCSYVESLIPIAQALMEKNSKVNKGEKMRMGENKNKKGSDSADVPQHGQGWLLTSITSDYSNFNEKSHEDDAEVGDRIGGRCINGH